MKLFLICFYFVFKTKHTCNLNCKMNTTVNDASSTAVIITCNRCHIPIQLIHLPAVVSDCEERHSGCCSSCVKQFQTIPRNLYLGGLEPHSYLSLLTGKNYDEYLKASRCGLLETMDEINNIMSGELKKEKIPLFIGTSNNSRSMYADGLERPNTYWSQLDANDEFEADVTLIMSQANVTKEIATAELIKHNGDVVDAILKLTK